MVTRMTAWAGIDIGKTHHWICAVDAEGRPLLSAKVANVEADLLAALAKVTGLAAEVVWAVDIIGAPSALILALLAIRRALANAGCDVDDPAGHELADCPSPQR